MNKLRKLRNHKLSENHLWGLWLILFISPIPFIAGIIGIPSEMEEGPSSGIIIFGLFINILWICIFDKLILN